MSLSQCAWSLACDAKRNWVCGRFVIRWYTSGSSECNFVEYVESLSRSAFCDRCGSIGAATAAVATGAASIATVAAAATAATIATVAATVAAAATARGTTDGSTSFTYDTGREGRTSTSCAFSRDGSPLAFFRESGGPTDARDKWKKSWKVRATVPILRLLFGRC